MPKFCLILFLAGVSVAFTSDGEIVDEGEDVSVTLLLSGLQSDLGSPLNISLTITQEKTGK